MKRTSRKVRSRMTRTEAHERQRPNLDARGLRPGFWSRCGHEPTAQSVCWDHLELAAKIFLWTPQTRLKISPSQVPSHTRQPSQSIDMVVIRLQRCCIVTRWMIGEVSLWRVQKSTRRTEDLVARWSTRRPASSRIKAILPLGVSMVGMVGVRVDGGILKTFWESERWVKANHDEE